MTDPTDKICAVVVTFRPSHALLANLALLAVQVDHIVIVDNGSHGASVEVLRIAASSSKTTLIQNTSNEGIARALNQGLQHGMSLGYLWFITFDQDSTACPDMAPNLLHCLRDAGAATGIAAPYYFNRELDRPLGLDLSPDGEVRTVLTSGMLFSRHLLETCGYMEDDLFIDMVDHEFCNRVRSYGFRIVHCADAKLLHSLGNMTKLRLLGREFEVRNYSPVRKYYQTRNCLWLLGSPKRNFDWWKVAKRQVVDMTWDYIKLLLAESDKWSKTRMIALGAWDAFTGRMGKRVNP